MKVPVGTTAERPGSPVEGLFRYNSTDRTFEGYSYDQDAGAVQWGPIAGAGSSLPDQSTNRYSATYTVGALLRSDGTNAYWSFDGENDTGWSTARIWTHGYVGGGYQNGSPWNNVNRTVHATDTSTNLGDILDRSGAYMARYIAKNLVAAGIAEKCTIQLAYIIGVAEPISVFLDTHGTG